MMTWKEGDFNFHYNSDFSGDVIITTPIFDEEIKVPGKILLQFIIQTYVLPRKQARLEEATPDELLGIYPLGSKDDE